jgi:hypothetical protein
MVDTSINLNEVMDKTIRNFAAIGNMRQKRQSILPMESTQMA